MKLEVLLSVLNLNKKNLDKMNITSRCTVINQCGKNKYEKYKNFNIYSYDELGVSNSRNRGLEHVSEDIILLCDDDVVYLKNYEKKVIDEFENNKKADIIIFNVINKFRNKRINKKNKKLHFYNSLNYATYNIAFRRKNMKDIKFNTLFGPNARYNIGEDTLFIVDSLKKKKRIYSSTACIGEVIEKKSTWFNGYNEKYFFDKGALFTAINPRFRHLLCLQYLIRHKEVLNDYNLISAYKIMLNGSRDYINHLGETNEN